MSYQNFFNYQFASNKDNDNYFVNQTNQKAYDITVLKNFNQNIFLFGPKKSGKSHLASIWKDKNDAVSYSNNFNKLIEIKKILSLMIAWIFLLKKFFFT